MRKRNLISKIKMNDAPQILNSMNNVQTAAELRHQLHAMKAQDRQAVKAAPPSSMSNYQNGGFNGGASVGSMVLSSPWFTAGVTGVATFALLYFSNPSFVQAANTEPSMRRVIAWSVLVTLLVAAGPLIAKWVKGKGRA
jgi:hypothetical protein